jgi:UDP-N-acetylglucosamine:LPS N-acetylglucosamine transferase
VEHAGAGICLAGLDSRSLGQALDRVLEQETNQEMRRACRELATPNGADQVARIILGLERLTEP